MESESFLPAFTEEVLDDIEHLLTFIANPPPEKREMVPSAKTKAATHYAPKLLSEVRRLYVHLAMGVNEEKV